MPDFVSAALAKSRAGIGLLLGKQSRKTRMDYSLYDSRGRRKYLVDEERLAFSRAALAAGGEVATFCAVILFCGPRISEALALTYERVDESDGVLIFETLKRRRRGIMRAVPVPPEVFELLDRVHGCRAAQHNPALAPTRLWSWSRTTAWRRVKAVARAAGIPEYLCTPKALRHGFCIAACLESVVLTLVSELLGHARLETTQIYARVLGREARTLVSRTWRGLLPAPHD